HPHLARDRTQVARFAREARAAATLRSEHAARIIDVDQLPSGELYMVMEYLEGTSLDRMVASRRGLPVADAVLYMVQACDALAEAHARSIIHRDVKPANLFLTTGKSGEPVIKVIDFGLAKSLVSSEELSSSSLSIAGQALGTPYYMAPEQCTGRSPIDARSDVWAIGATLYELLTGHLAFNGATAPVVFDKILAGKPTPVLTRRPDVPAPLVEIVGRCLMHDPALRFQTVAELSHALQASLAAPFVAAPLSTDRFVRSSAPPPLPVPAPVRGASSVRPSGPSVRQTILAALAGPALLAVAAACAVVIMRTSVGAGVSSPAAARATASKAVYLTARSGDATRSKAPPEPEKPERRRR
ncbi:MAG TPA: serine/threonine-protein kinase, partial [Labilithrix sp.]|nr:serine/threonine-protein kinase [Labilithrix sp.]